MSNIHPVSKTRHANKFWHRPENYAFARAYGILPLGLSELPKATPTLLIAFVAQGEGFQPVAVMSILPDRNHYIVPSGDWLHGYLPTAIRAYPFSLHSAQDGRQLVCVNEDAGLINENPDGEPVFLETGELSAAMKEMLDLLHENQQGVKAAMKASATLQQYGLIRPWPITVQSDAGKKSLAGLYQVDEAALNQLPAEGLLALRNSGALMMAYCQLLSMQHLQFLGQLAGIHAQAEKKQAEDEETRLPDEIDLEFLKRNDSLNFGSFR